VIESGKALFRWDGFWVGPCCFEERNPQDFIRGIPDNPSVPWSTHGFPHLPMDAPAIPTGDCVGLFPRGRFRLLNSWLLDSLMLDSPPVTGGVVTHSWLLQLNGSSILQLNGDHILVS
jgi:hypothetical protein